MSDKKIIIIDGNSLINRAFYAIPLLTNKEGVCTNAVYGFVNMLFKIMEDYQPDYISVAFDRKAPTFRHMEYGDYKAGRKKMPSELAQQMPLLKEILDAFRIHRIELDGFEADDLIGTLVKYCEGQNIDPIVVTGDHDALQLASHKTKILITKKGITSLETYDTKGVLEKYEVTPLQFIDLKGLMGDKSDNIPGVPGIGEKTAIKLIKEFGSIEELLQNIEKVSNEKLRTKLNEYAEQAVFSKRLATIKVDVPVEISLEELKMEEPNQEQLLDLFEQLEFHSLLSKIQKETIKTETSKNDLEYKKVITNGEEVKLLISDIEKHGSFYVKTFTDGIDIISDNIIGISILLPDEKFYYIDTKENQQLIFGLKNVFEEQNIKKSGHNLKKDIIALKKYDINFTGLFFDSIIALYLLEPTRTNYEIHDISAQYLKKTFPTEEEVLGKGKSKVRYSGAQTEQLIEIGANECITVKQTKDILLKKIDEYGLNQLLTDVEIPLIEVLAEMEYNGFMVDRNKLDEIGSELNEKLQIITNEIYELSGEIFNINSTKQLGEVLFEKLGLPTVKKTKTGYSTNIEVLEKLYEKHEIIPKIIEYRQLGKLKSTYIDGLIAVINPDTHKIHSSFNQTVTSTGRISSTEPNLQNIPIKLAIGREIRKVFIPTDKEYLLLDADYSQIELRVLAHISQDNNLIEAFHLELDVHTATASKVFNVPIEEVTPLQRSRAKAVNFGIVYGISDYGLSENLGITRKEAQKYIDEYFKKYCGVKKYMEDIVKDGKEKGYVTTLLNRRRYIPEIHSANFNLRSFGERTAMNTPIQGSAADIIKLAMIKVYHSLKRKKLKSKLILQVHDELIIEVHHEELTEVKEILQTQMEQALSLSVPLSVDMNVGKNWYDTK